MTISSTRSERHVRLVDDLHPHPGSEHVRASAPDERRSCRSQPMLSDHDCLSMQPPLCCATVPPAHWVPDSQLQQCSTCGDTFNLVVRRHHCRCCGGIFCDACSSGRTSLPGWGIQASVRVCDDCRRFEAVQLPMLLAGDVFVKPGDWTGLRNKRFLRLSADQSRVVWTPWRRDEGRDDTAEKSAPASRLTCVSEEVERAGLVLAMGSEKLSFEAREPAQARAWAAALSRLLAINQQRHSYERLFGGVAPGLGSPRSVEIATPAISRLLEARSTGLVEAKQRALLVEAMTHSTSSWERMDAEEDAVRAERDAEAQRERRRARKRELERSIREKCAARPRTRYQVSPGGGVARRGPPPRPRTRAIPASPHAPTWLAAQVRSSPRLRAVRDPARFGAPQPGPSRENE